jgi:hypothetical protein
MTIIQIIGIIVVALLGGYVFFCIYDIGKRKTENGERKTINKNR